MPNPLGVLPATMKCGPNQVGCEYPNNRCLGHRAGRPGLPPAWYSMAHGLYRAENTALLAADAAFTGAGAGPAPMDGSLYALNLHDLYLLIRHRYTQVSLASITCGAKAYALAEDREQHKASLKLHHPQFGGEPTLDLVYGDQLVAAAMAADLYEDRMEMIQRQASEIQRRAAVGVITATIEEIGDKLAPLNERYETLTEECRLLKSDLLTLVARFEKFLAADAAAKHEFSALEMPLEKLATSKRWKCDGNGVCSARSEQEVKDHDSLLTRARLDDGTLVSTLEPGSAVQCWSRTVHDYVAMKFECQNPDGTLNFDLKKKVDPAKCRSFVASSASRWSSDDDEGATCRNDREESSDDDIPSPRHARGVGEHQDGPRRKAQRTSSGGDFAGFRDTDDLD